MENLTKFKLNRRRWAVQLALTTGLALLFLAALLWGLRGVTPARADPGDLYVDGASGQDIPTCGTTIAPCQTISYTVNSRASNGDTILIAAGTYTENLTISGITLTLRGGYTISGTLWLTGTSETVVDGGYSDRVFFIHHSDSVLENLTISGGASSECWGDAVWVTDGNVTIRSSTIKDNNGGCIGIEVNDDYGPGHLTLESSTVSNMGGSALHLWGHLWEGSASAVISNSQIISNSGHEGGGIYAEGGSSVDVVDSIIADNLAEVHGGAVSANQATVNLTNVLLTGNKATSDNANVLAVNNSDVTIMNSTISDNNPQGAQAVILWSGHLTITNSILWNNALSLQGDPPCPTCFTVTYSDIEGGWPGTGNINTDPLFVGGGDYRLQMGSPCIDAGTNTGAPDHDLDQRQRPQDGDGDGTATADVGAYEFRLYRIYLPLTLRNFGP
jgi:hypothetical protein